MIPSVGAEKNAKTARVLQRVVTALMTHSAEGERSVKIVLVSLKIVTVWTILSVE